MDKNYLNNLLYSLNGIMTILWIFIYIYFNNLFNTNHLAFDSFIFILPIFSIWLNNYYVSKKIALATNDEELIKTLNEGLAAEQAFSDVLPITIFGTGILLTNFISNLSTVMHDFILLIIFGLLIPLLTDSLLFSVSDIPKKLVHESISYTSEIIGFTLFFIIFRKLFTQPYDIYKQYLIVFKNKNMKKPIDLENYISKK